MNLKGLLHSLGGAVFLNAGHDNLFQVIKADHPIAARKSLHKNFNLSEKLAQSFLVSGDKFYFKENITSTLLSELNQLLPGLNWAEVYLIIPLVIDGFLVNLYVFGASSDGKDYVSKNLDIITAFLSQAKTSFQNALLYQREEKLRLRFQKYVPKQIVEDAFSGVDSVGDGIEKKVVILFSDIRGFTSFCENKKTW